MTIQQIKLLVRNECGADVYHGVIVPIVKNTTYNVCTNVSVKVARFETHSMQIHRAIENEKRDTDKPDSGATK